MSYDEIKTNLETLNRVLGIKATIIDAGEAIPGLIGAAAEKAEYLVNIVRQDAGDYQVEFINTVETDVEVDEFAHANDAIGHAIERLRAI